MVNSQWSMLLLGLMMAANSFAQGVIDENMIVRIAEIEVYPQY